jgi:hypothetical protein
MMQTNLCKLPYSGTPIKKQFFQPVPQTQRQHAAEGMKHFAMNRKIINTKKQNL